MRVAEVFGHVIGQDAPIRLIAYDGSKSGPDDAEIALRIESPRALARLASAPGTLGLARAYVTGEIDVEGDLYTALASLSDITLNGVSKADFTKLLATVGPVWLRYRPAPPELEARPRGRLHSKFRDSQAISHHYDVSNTFYEWVLGPSMTYTCAAYPGADATLEQAQAAKYELVANKLALEPGMRLLDVGCGWAGMVRHAARMGVHALGVTLSKEQAEWGQAAIRREGLEEFAEVRHLDYRDVPETGFDAVSSIGLTEHIGKKQLSSYFGFLYGKLRPEGRLLNHCITQPHTVSKRKVDPFIGRYVFPDGQLESPGLLMTKMHDAGFEVRHEENLREHYAMTLRDWGRNLEEHWTEAVEEVGIGRARVWRLYMAACRLGFDLNNIQLHQMLGVKLGEHGRSGTPLRGWRAEGVW